MGYKIDLTKSDEMGRTITYYKDTIDRGRVERVYKRSRNETHKYLVSSVSTSSEISPIDMVTIIRLMIVHEKMGHMHPRDMKALLLNYSATMLSYTLEEINIFIKYFNCAPCRSGKSTYRLSHNKNKSIMPSIIRYGNHEGLHMDTFWVSYEDNADWVFLLLRSHKTEML